MSTHPLQIFTGSAHPTLAVEVARYLGTGIGKSTTRRMPDSETYVTIDEAVRDKDIFLIQPCTIPVNDSLMEVLLFLDAFRRASAHSVTIVMPYFPYARQDRMARGREAISARVAVNLLETQGASRVIFIDIHNRAIQGFFTIPVDPISALPLLAEQFKGPKFRDASIVSPDVGRAGMAGRFAELTNLPLVVMHKRRTGVDTTETTHVVGNIEGRQPVVIDDLMAGGSVLKQIDALYKLGAEGKTYFAVTHAILLPTAIEILQRDDRIERLVVSNTLPLKPDQTHPKVEVISVGPLLADIIHRIHKGISISEKLVYA